MKLTAIILASALGTAPPAIAPAALKLENGQSVRRQATEGCYVFNTPGLESVIAEAFDAGTREKCGRAI